MLKTWQNLCQMITVVQDEREQRKRKSGAVGGVEWKVNWKIIRIQASHLTIPRHKEIYALVIFPRKRTQCVCTWSSVRTSFDERIDR